MTRDSACSDHPLRHRISGYMAAGPDGPPVRAGHAGGEDRRGVVHERGPGEGCDPQLRHGWLRLAVPEVQRAAGPRLEARVEQLYAIADGKVVPEDGEPEVVFCMHEFGPLNLMPNPGRQWAAAGASTRTPPGNRAAGGGPCTTATAVCATSSQPWTWPGTSSTATSSRSRSAPSFWSSAATCALSTRPRSASRSSVTTSPRT